MQQQRPRRGTLRPSRWMSGATVATSSLHEIRDMVVDETEYSERDARQMAVTPSESSPASLSGAWSGRLRELVFEMLRVAFHRTREGGSIDGATEDVRGMMGEVCATARANDLRVEALILDLKSTWRRLPEVHGVTRLDAEIALAEVITLCIKEYYAPGSASTRHIVTVRPANRRDDSYLT